MSFWHEQVLPRATDRILGVGQVHKLRSRACEGLGGHVVEIGYGSGLNAEHYPSAVTSVAAVEPLDVAWGLAQRRIEQTSAEVFRAGLDGQRLDLATGSFDSALSTFTMCTVPDLDAALSELARVLEPGGSLHFLEHGLAPDPGVAKWQHRLDPVQGLLAGGCHLDRDIRGYVERSGLELVEIDTFYGFGPKVVGYVYLGRAVKR
ncbi:MAG: class I SAM-dependent methyltransferase [Nocardioidaceae bacterium]